MSFIFINVANQTKLYAEGFKRYNKMQDAKLQPPKLVFIISPHLALSETFRFKNAVYRAMAIKLTIQMSLMSSYCHLPIDLALSIK